MNEQEKFLKDTEQKEEVDIFDIPLEPTETVYEKKIDENPELAPDSIKDRRHKRLEAKLQAERESNIALNARLEVISQARKSEETPSEYLKNIERIYGTDTPEATAATELLKNALKGVGEESTRKALEAFRQEQAESDKALKTEEGALESMLEDIEDDYNVDLTSEKSETLRKAFYKNLERVSPKDSEGNILHYADHRAVWEDLQSKIIKKPENRAKNLADRSMIQSSPTETKLQEDSSLKFLKDNGII